MIDYVESLAMKGLFLSNLNKKEDGYEHVRLGLKYCLRSHVCWHVYGLLYRADKNYDEAIKCYRNALRFDKDNGQILRELAVLQLQTRQYSALVETRYQLLTLRPVVKLNWVSLAVAYHLGGQHDQAVGVLEAIFDGFPVESDTRAYQIEQSELIFYKSFILEESGRYEEAYKALDRSNFSIVDSVEWGKRRAGLMMKMNMIEEAQRMWEELFDLNPDSKATLAKLLDCTRTDNFTSLSQLAQKYPHSLLLKSELIRCAPKEQLLHVLSNLIIPMVKRGIPNAFSILRNLYHSEENIHVIRQMISSLEEGTSADSTDLESAAWTHVLIAQHYSIVDSSPESAIKHMESAVSLNPNVPEIFFQYAKILRRLGNLEKAANCMDYARRLDLSDRFLNSKAVKYFLRAGRIEEAKEMAVLFVKKGEIDTRLQDLVEMQVLWYAREMGRAYQAAGNHTEALIYFNQCRKHFEDFYDDQFDFHNYVLRRMTLCSYIK